jgi:hypothetical protein
MYDQETDQWYAVAGVANEGHSYNWTAPHTFGSIVTINDVIRAKGGVNRFTTENDRDAILGLTPPLGTSCFVVQKGAGGTDIWQLQVYLPDPENTANSKWQGMYDTSYIKTKSSDYTLLLEDAGRTIIIDSTIDRTVTVPSNASVPFAIGQRLDVIRMNTGNVTIGGTPTILSKNSNKKIAARYSGATLIKTDTDTWVLIGDLTA